MSPIWASTSQFYSIDDSDHNVKLNKTQSSDGIETEPTNKNFAKMRSYFKRCENAINSINLSGKRSTSSPDASSSAVAAPTDYNIRATKSSSSWYIDELASEIDESHNEFSYNDSHSKVIQIMEPTIHTVPDTQSLTIHNEYANDRIESLEHHSMLLLVSRICNHF